QPCPVLNLPNGAIDQPRCVARCFRRSQSKVSDLVGHTAKPAPASPARAASTAASCLESASCRYGAALIHVHCLESKHYHLLVDTPHGTFALGHGIFCSDMGDSLDSETPVCQ
ncbi:MAG: hypothetical protein AAGU11_21500, partial [Syntrophobacteraceae bacterium]